MTFAESRRRHDELYWSEIWAKANGGVSQAAELAGVHRGKARRYLELLGLRARDGAFVPKTTALLSCLLQPDVVRRVGRQIDGDELEAFTNDQRVAISRWLLALGDEQSHHYEQVVPGFLLACESEAS